MSGFEVIHTPCENIALYTHRPVSLNVVHISDTFAVCPLIQAYNRNEEYLIMLLSQGGVNLYEIINDTIVSEINNGDFPFSENPHCIIEPKKLCYPNKWIAWSENL